MGTSPSIIVMYRMVVSFRFDGFNAISIQPTRTNLIDTIWDCLNLVPQNGVLDVINDEPVGGFGYPSYRQTQMFHFFIFPIKTFYLYQTFNCHVILRESIRCFSVFAPVDCGMPKKLEDDPQPQGFGILIG